MRLVAAVIGCCALVLVSPGFEQKVWVDEPIFAAEEVADDDLDSDVSAGDSDGVLADDERDSESDATVAVDERPWTARATITAYCISGIMQSGRHTYVGAVATDRSVIPAGSLIEIEGRSGVFTSEDTGSGVRGWWVDVYTPSCADARAWGRQTRAIRVVRWGW